MISALTLVFTFQTANALAFAFGMAITITITTALFFYLARERWGRPLWLVVAGAGGFLTVDLLFLGANLTKLTHGAWLPLLIGVTVFTIFTTWQRGRALVTQRRAPGTAVFLHHHTTTTPLAVRANVEQNHILHEHVVILSSETRHVPHVGESDRLAIDDLGDSEDGITHVAARFDDRPPHRQGRRHEPLAQASLPGDVAHHRRCGRVLRPAAPPHRHHGVTHRHLVGTPRARAGV